MLDRRTFVLGAAVTAVAATSVGTANAATPALTGIGVASLGGTPVTLARLDGRGRGGYDDRNRASGGRRQRRRNSVNVERRRRERSAIERLRS